MAFEFRFPDVGEGIHEGTIVKWKVKLGDTVKEDDPLGEIETAKAIVEIPSPKTGVVLKLGAEEGAMIKVGDVLAVIGAAGEKYEPGQKPQTPEQPKGVGVVGELQEATGGMPLSGSASQKPAASKSSGEVNALPFVRKLAADLKVDLAKISGTGPGGRITEDDVKKAGASSIIPAASSPPSAIKKVRKYDMWGYIDHVPLKGMRKTIAAQMVKSAFTIPHVTHFDVCDVTELVAFREKQKPEAEKLGIKLTYLAYIVKATLKALQEFPTLNASLDSANDDIIVKKYFNIGIAVDTPDGLMVPVLKRIDQKSVMDCAKEIQELAEKARARKIDLMDLRGGSFTITNIGSIGGTFFTPVINHPESAILGIASMKKEAVVKDGKIEIRDMLHLGVSFDHRIIDGATAARFLNAVIAQLQNPAGIL